MAHSQTNNVLVYVRMYAVTERRVVGRQVDCSILWLQQLQSSYYLLQEFVMVRDGLAKLPDCFTASDIKVRIRALV